MTPTSPTPNAVDHTDDGPARLGASRRGFLGYVVGATTLVVAADLRLGTPAYAAVASPPQIAEAYDLEDLQTDAARPTSQMITIAIEEDGTATFAIPRMEVGQGITTSTAMIIAEELDLPVDKVRVSLAPARPELVFNQLTGGSNTTVSTFTPIRVAAAIAKGALLEAAAIELGSAVALLKSKDGVVTAPGGASATFAELAAKAASSTTKQVKVDLKKSSSFEVIGKPVNRIDARDIVTGKKQFAMDLDIPDALPTMVCRPPTMNGSVRSVRNQATVQAMPGVTDVAKVDTGVAVRARTFGQCIDAHPRPRRGLDPGPGRRRVGRDRPEEAAQGGGAAGDAQGPPAGEDHRG